MNKKFLSVILSASMALSPMGGYSCFAVDSENKKFIACLKDLKECTNRNMDKNIELFLKSNELNQTTPRIEATRFSFPSDAYVSLDNCYDALKKCTTKNAELSIEMLRRDIPQESCNGDSKPEESNWLWFETFVVIELLALGSTCRRWIGRRVR